MDLRKNLVRIGGLALLALFLLPGLTYALAHHMLAEVTGGADVLAPALSPIWQFQLAQASSFWTLVGGAALLVLMAALGALAFSRRSVQYGSFVAGWVVLVVAGALEVLVQGAFLVWLSYWVTAWFFHMYAVKLIFIALVIAGAAVITAIVAIFKRAELSNNVMGELVDETQAPHLWARIRELAGRAGTAPPAQLVAGIDANFFVTESPLQVGERKTAGRALYVSVPLLRVLDQAEADAVLAHELGHFVGGDTENSAALGPKLAQFDLYLQQVSGHLASLVAYYPLALYRMIFELALSRSSREREFAADSLASALVSARALSRALVKVAAYSNYRDSVESELFQQRERHVGQIGIGQRVAQGLPAFSQSAAFDGAMRSGGVPHPFDSHPPLAERIRASGFALSQAQYAEVVREEPADRWTDAIENSDGLESRLWATFEQQFAAQHEFVLAHRYEPANDEERALVLRFFPDVDFLLKDGAELQVNHSGLVLPDSPQSTLPWDMVAGIKYEDASIGSDTVTITHPRDFTRKSTKQKLSITSAERTRLKEVMGRYWARHQAMRQFAKDAPASGPVSAG